jgi:hypothetical protein
MICLQFIFILLFNFFHNSIAIVIPKYIFHKFYLLFLSTIYDDSNYIVSTYESTILVEVSYINF